MGIRGLENFIRKSGALQKIDIRHEIKKWHRDHNCEPTIVIDLQEVVKYFGNFDAIGAILGGRFSKCNEILNHFFNEIKKCQANLVFIMRLDLIETGRTEEGFQNILSAYDCLKQQQSLKSHLNEISKMPWKFETDLLPYERLTYNILTSICPKYGQIHTYHGMDIRAILTYVRQNETMAVITRDTEYFVHDCDFDHWSLSGVHFGEMKIDRFIRNKLNNALGLNLKQMQLLMPISKFTFDEKIKLIQQLQPAQGHSKSQRHDNGDNQIKKLTRSLSKSDQKQIPEFGTNKKNRLDARVKITNHSQSKPSNVFITLIDYVKSQQCGANGYDTKRLTCFLPVGQRQKISDDINYLSKINNYNGNWNNDIYNELILTFIIMNEKFNSTLLFCRQNLYFAYKLMNESKTVMKELLFMDTRRPYHQFSLPFIDLVIKITMKLTGILFKDINDEQRPKTRTIKVSRNANKEATESEVRIIYPMMALSTFNVIVEEEIASFDESRWLLLGWLLELNEETISYFRESKDVKYIRAVLLTLMFLLKHESISVREADNILLTEWEGLNKNVPCNSQPGFQMPQSYYPDVDIKWVHIAHRYTISFELVCHCLEICGLRKHTDIIQFDAFGFHANMKDKKSNERFKIMMDALSHNPLKLSF